MKFTRLKDLIKNKDSQVSFQDYRLRYATERFLMRVQASSYKDKLIIKGGFLLGIIYKIEQRTTQDLDTLIKGLAADRQTIKKMLSEIIAIELEDGIEFELIQLQDSQKNRVYDGFRAKLKMTHLEEPTNIIFDLDLGVGDVVTPEPQLMNIPLLFNEKKGETEVLSLFAYPLETVLAEKTEIILTLGTDNSRMKDFYDMHLLLNDPNMPSMDKVYQAFANTWSFRHGELEEDDFEDWLFIMRELERDTKMRDLDWPNYIKNRDYAKAICWEDILAQVRSYVLNLKAIHQQK